jgi:hypothetical protein
MPFRGAKKIFWLLDFFRFPVHILSCFLVCRCDSSRWPPPRLKDFSGVIVEVISSVAASGIRRVERAINLVPLVDTEVGSSIAGKE